MKTTFDFTGSGTFELEEDGGLVVRNSRGNHIYSKNSNELESWFEYDMNNNVIHFNSSSGYEQWYEYNDNHTRTHFKDSDRNEYWYDSKGNITTEEIFNSTNK